MNFTKKETTIILNVILFLLLWYIFYKLYHDVNYKMQVQIPLISKTYFWFDSREFCMFLFIVYLFCILFMRWWFSLIFLISLCPMPIILQWMNYRYVYRQGFINGIIWYREIFNFNFNFYLYKTLEDWMKSWVVWKEISLRKNSTSFLIYDECKDFWLDPYIVHFFDDFKLDYNDSDSFDRIREQLDIYQRAKIKLARWQIIGQYYQYKADHPIKYYASKTFNFILENPEAIYLGSLISIVMFSVLWYHIVEEPFYYRIIGRPTVEVSSDDVTVWSDFFLQNFGKINPNSTLELILFNFREMLQNSIDLLNPISRSLLYDANPEINRAILDKIIPKVLNNQFIFVKIIDHLEENMSSPFEQFEVNVLQRISFFGLDFSFSNLTLYLVLSIIVILSISYLITRSLSLIPNYWQSVIEIFYSFLFSMLIDQAGKKAKVFFPAIFSLFFFILVMNLLGLIPLSFAVTSHVVITFCLGFGFFVAWIIVAFKVIGLKIFNIFWPTNVPLWLRPLLMVVEILSFTLRPLSLSIRLFVNILAGHILLHLVSGSVVLVFSKAAIFSFIPFVLLLAVFCLELGIAFLQAYIFSILLCIYLHDSYHSHN